MTGYLLDTEHLGILQRKTQPACANIERRMASLPNEAFSVSIVTFQELAGGWLAHLNRSRKLPDLVFGYGMLQDVVVDFRHLTIRAFDDTVGAEFDRLRRTRIRVGTLDLRIGATALVHQLVVLTRNNIDFERIPGVHCEDWTT